jgi:hypothetical protein
MKHDNWQFCALFSAAVLGAGCTCELTLGPGAHDEAPPPTHTVVHSVPAPAVTQQASATALAPKPLAATPVAEPPPFETTGVLSEASVRKTESRHHGELRFCMEQGAAPADSPKVRIQFVVKPDGSVHDRIDVLERSDASDKLATCLVQAVKRWKFEQPKDGAARATLLLKR